MSKRFIYGGRTVQLGQHHIATTGTVVELSDQEAAVVAGNTDFFEEPTRAKLEKKIYANASLTTADSGKIIRCNHDTDITITLEAEPTSGDNFQIYYGGGADPAKNVTIDLAGKFCVGENFLLSEVAIQAAGTGYHADDVLTVVGGTHSVVATVKVDSIGTNGIITGVSVVATGAYSVRPDNPASVTGGLGTGAKLTLTWGQAALSLTSTDDSLGLYFNGAMWVRY